MSLAEIEAELKNLTRDELRELALTSWRAFVNKESATGQVQDCIEDDPQILAALDEAVDRAESTPLQVFSGSDIRSFLRKWTSK